MATPNPQVAEELRQAQDELARLKAEKLQRYPPNPHPFVDPDYFMREFSETEIRARNQLIERIEQLEQRIQAFQDRLYQK